MNIESLRDISLNFKINPKKTIGHAATIDSILTVLNNVNKSYTEFIEIEFFKNSIFKKAHESNSKVIVPVLERLNLLAVNLSFSSFEISLAPNLLENNIAFFSSEIKDWEKDAYSKYRDDIILGDHNNSEYLKHINSMYNEDERSKIFKPLFQSFGNGKEYDLLTKKQFNSDYNKVLIKPIEKINYYYKNQSKKFKQSNDDVKVVAYLSLKDNESKLSQKNINKVLYIENLEYDTYPYKPNIISFEGYIFILKNRLNCEVLYENELYYISYLPLDINVWGSTREEAEDAFTFMFYSIYENFALEIDSNLTNSAVLMKNHFNKIVDKVVNEK